MTEPKGLIRLVEDDAPLLAATVQGLRLSGFETEAFDTPLPALEGLSRDWPGVVLSDVRMPGIDGIELAKRIRAIDPELPVVLLTGHGDVEMAVQALRDGVYDFMTKPTSRATLETTLARALSARRLVLENRRLREAQATIPALSEGLIGTSPVIQHLRQTAEHIAAAEMNALFTGETGVGKERLARHIHSISARRSRPFIAVHCGAINPDRFEADYFGTVSAGGPLMRTYGRIETASRGMLYLDGIDAMPLEMQARMLEAIETGRIWPQGASAARQVDLWVIASSAKDLSGMVATGTFRADLYYRLSGLTLPLPPLKVRREDVPHIFRHFATRVSERTGRKVPLLSPVIQAHLDCHDWPGNLRELEQYAEAFCTGIKVDPSINLPDASLSEMMDRYEATLLRNALQVSKGNATAAMERLGISRKTFYSKLLRYGIRADRYR
ncbi:sigma-54-dependent Fis family transcriptional regulator [Donghicola sp. C2-DW-16]|uniref:Sigma-54-dependent Fis family transcriptional regulator n=1 Tax=Donghicola mangrovi TaxID=2729614 RepID=A0ABX2PLP5_9RHOB|nr:sigma-54 dependent transcriptional regulator [Donghicola mangrovi]NVO29419.1 sigma-54-dependent Fis family transcriptional regulator [Donghicola mangrovi]